ncbi:hypothetical protein [Nonomuraea diastatica]|uniref:Secreted protein n=1 Tax=Nonomuraea diastatica TaxID=1848329 RepID=A0A4V2YF34_9ACTN|nr:hypothetical protein [Nonomuraea diastatica]TDD21617.1 hypothetical protein E1294_14390 [Nonomuraea diastatica]
MRAKLRRVTVIGLAALTFAGFGGFTPPAAQAAARKTITFHCGAGGFVGQIKVNYQGTWNGRSVVTFMWYRITPANERRKHNIKVVDYGKRGSTGPVVDIDNGLSYGNDWNPLRYSAYERTRGKVRIEFVFDRKGPDPRCKQTV